MMSATQADRPEFSEWRTYRDKVLQHWELSVALPSHPGSMTPLGELKELTGDLGRCCNFLRDHTFTRSRSIMAPQSIVSRTLERLKRYKDEITSMPNNGDAKYKNWVEEYTADFEKWVELSSDMQDEDFGSGVVGDIDWCR